MLAKLLKYEMKKSAEATMENYKSTYGDSYKSFLEYNGIADDKELKDILIKNAVFFRQDIIL